MKISDEDEVEIENLIIDTPYHYTVYSGVEQDEASRSLQR